ncbi:MAG: glycosyltransferase 87 family protein [Nitrososphaerota archaeon]
MDERRAEIIVYVIAVFSWILSGLIHHPELGWSIYSDINSFWWRPDSAEQLRRGEAPCFQFFFEYPPASCLTIYVSAIMSSGEISRYYQAFFYLSLPAYIALAWSIINVARMSGAGLLGLVFIASPSLVVYGIYNFDHFAAAMSGIAVVFMMRRRFLISGLAAGIGFAFKLYPAFIVPVALLECRGRERYVLFAAFLAAAAPLFIIQEIINPGMLARFYEYHSGWGLENAWYIWIFFDQFSPTAKLLGTLLGAFLVIQAWLARGPPLSKIFLAVSAWLMMSYIFTPQMTIWLLPLFPAVSRSVLPYWPSFEISNVSIILTWFGDYNPLMPPAPPQIMALVRAFSLALMMISVYRAYIRRS